MRAYLFDDDIIKAVLAGFAEAMSVTAISQFRAMTYVELPALRLSLRVSLCADKLEQIAGLRY